MITRLPGTGCRFYERGRCLYEERLNPGYHEEWRCAVLVRWEGVYEDFLRQAEAFGLTDAAASALWQRRFERLAAAPPECPRFQPGPTDELPGCALSTEGLCVLALPECAGQCQHFEPRAKTPESAPSKE